jgi:hypothetical protein
MHLAVTSCSIAAPDARLQCTDDLAVWCIVTAGILFVITILSVLDGACGLRGMGSDGLPALASRESDSDLSDDEHDAHGGRKRLHKAHAKSRPEAQPSFTVLAIIQLVTLLSFVVAWAYGE